MKIFSSRPVYISHRPKKDPRDLKILDPACGSGHFLLYSFDLLETIYEEAWSDEQQVPSEADRQKHSRGLSGIARAAKAVPQLILRHNLHGIDIDLRACQIAALALWLRAQRTYQRQTLKLENGPKSHAAISSVRNRCRENEALLEQFVVDLQPKVLGQLVRSCSRR